MSVIPMSQLSLMRVRRELKQLMGSGKWQKIIAIEADLFIEMDSAVQDAERSPKELLNELGQVVNLYKELSNLCCIFAQEHHQPQR
ncbi:MAG: hypothetical protein ACJAUP_001711 [Cellvibrionaceae bacterium]|jgi:hypothetical protein